MAARLTTADYLHRTLVSGLAALSAYGLYGMFRVHNDNMAAADAAYKKHLAEQAEQLGAASPLVEGRVDPPPQRPS
ncbi:hypothetical protein OIO90_005001 [Microbotryomycetes sp. JL221]|nr:hypothetical protein OIO90_005001 [Microbotryomycetes sp. JL221]